MSRGYSAIICGGNDPTCPHDPKFEHRRWYPYSGACVPKNLSDTTGTAKGYPQRLNPATGKWAFDGGCDKYAATTPNNQPTK